ncbi:hypothetical protein [Bacillus taeanensis]|uniref:Uncharacterized protein n=1 Tax=Bacillus taeanensis TaxID=273032 RepID=A0A366XYT0_9BACI|nr:hypothetical protein [Bacillus taeanensis]RBW71312.1 hypothetical protein DS031_00745 [Bacillus taeanensis]
MQIHCDGCGKVMNEHEILHMVNLGKWYCGHSYCLENLEEKLSAVRFIEWAWMWGDGWEV